MGSTDRINPLNFPMRRPFTQHLEQLEEQTSRPTSRRIAELLSDIEAALLKGFSRAQVVSALKTEGIDVTPAELSTYLHRLRKRASATNPSTSVTERIVPTTAAGPVTASPVTSGKKPFEPGDIRAIARNRPDLNELARLGREAALKAKANKP